MRELALRRRPRAAIVAAVNERLQGLAPYPMIRLDELKGRLEAQGRRVFDFGTGDPREPTPPAIREAFAKGMPEISQYPKVTGLPEMRRAAAGYLRRRFGVTVDPDRELLPTQGSKEAIFHLPMTLLDPSSERNIVVYGVPAYPVFEIGSYFGELPTHEVELNTGNRYELHPDLVPADVLARTGMVFLNYPHNPSGQRLPAEVFEAWIKARDQHGFVLIGDECYVDLYYDDEPPRTLLEFGRTGCLIVHSLSKRSGMTGYRSGFVAGDADLVATYRRFRAGMGVAPTEPVQRAAVVAWSDDTHIEERRAIFAQKRAVLAECFADRGLKVWPAPTGLFLWAEVPNTHAKDGVEYAERMLEEHGVLLSPGSFFGPGQERFIRLALVPSVDECREVAALWPRAEG